MKLSLILKKQQPNKNGECEIFYRIRSKVGDTKISTDIFVKPKDFKNGSIKTHLNYHIFYLHMSLINLWCSIGNH